MKEEEKQLVIDVRKPSAVFEVLPEDLAGVVHDYLDLPDLKLLSDSEEVSFWKKIAKRTIHKRLSEIFVNDSTLKKPVSDDPWPVLTDLYAAHKKKIHAELSSLIQEKELSELTSRTLFYLQLMGLFEDKKACAKWIANASESVACYLLEQINRSTNITSKIFNYVCHLTKPPKNLKEKLVNVFLNSNYQHHFFETSKNNFPNEASVFEISKKILININKDLNLLSSYMETNKKIVELNNTDYFSLKYSIVAFFFLVISWVILLALHFFGDYLSIETAIVIGSNLSVILGIIPVSVSGILLYKICTKKDARDGLISDMGLNERESLMFFVDGVSSDQSIENNLIQLNRLRDELKLIMDKFNSQYDLKKSKKSINRHGFFYSEMKTVDYQSLADCNVDYEKIENKL